MMRNIMNYEKLKDVFTFFGLAILFYIITMDDVFPVVVAVIKFIFYLFLILFVLLGISSVFNKSTKKD